MVQEGIQAGSDRTAREQDVVHQDDRAHVSEGKLFYKGKLVAEKAPLKA